MNTYHITIEGNIQGVGFRPFIYRLAKTMQLQGKVWNSYKGVEVLLQVSPSGLEAFLTRLETEKPPNSKITTIHTEQIEDSVELVDFTIEESTHEKSLYSVVIPPDVGICKKCQSELFDPMNRRYLYPFIGCAECGPRYTIMKSLPFDRQKCSMDTFKLCKECQIEYQNPNERRFHAQIISCPECGPKLSLYDHTAKHAEGQKALELATQALEEGKIVAMKGFGGYHLLCDATHSKAVESLRQRKSRPSKPFAILVKNIEDAKDLVALNSHEEALLHSAQRPILLAKKKNISNLSGHIAPHIDTLGVLLPYSATQLLLAEGFKKPLVVTSANVSGAPICVTYREIQKVKHLWDLCLDHNLEVINRCDDSLVMSVENRCIMIRNARGYAPAHIKLPSSVSKSILSVGANQKSTISLCFEGHVITSPYIGDIISLEGMKAFEHTVNFFEHIYHFTPDEIICDAHPGYETSKWAKRQQIEVAEVQHHVAHITSVMLEYQVDHEVLGVAFDGTGYGDDGKLWGGEFLRCTPQHYQRVGHLKYFKLLGGEASIKEPRRIALSLLFSLYGKETLKLKNPAVSAFTEDELENLFMMYDKHINAPLSSSVGRLFDAVASLTGICHHISYEGESGLRMESYYDEHVTQSYSFEVADGEVDWSIMVQAILTEEDPVKSVSKFFNTLVDIIVYFHKSEGLALVLSGGVFQNKTLVKLILQKIPDVIISENLPVNDGGISIGQAAVAINRI